MFNIKQHLIDRYVDLNIHKPHTTNTSATFMLYNLSKQLVGWQRYSPLQPHLCSNDLNGRYYTYRSAQQLAIFGFETYNINLSRIFITEGIFDAVRITRHHCCALALLTNSPNSSMLNLLSCLPNKITVIIDNDKGGELLYKKTKSVTSSFITPPAKDLGECDEAFITTILKV